MTEQGNQNIRSKVKTPGKEEVIAFRLEKNDCIGLDKAVQDLGIKSVKSRGHVSRKIVKDFLMGRLVYITPEHQLLDPARNRPIHPDLVDLA